jgi:hypothetical protein
MTIDPSSISAIAIAVCDRFGFPVLFFAALVWLAYLVVRGPATRLAEKAGEGFAAICRAGVDYLSELTKSLHKTHVEHLELRHHVTQEAATTREVLSREVRAISNRGCALGDAGVVHQGGAGPRSGSRPTMPSCELGPENGS